LKIIGPSPKCAYIDETALIYAHFGDGPIIFKTINYVVSVYCVRAEVRPKQHALECDSCFQWQINKETTNTARDKKKHAIWHPIDKLMN
jgi:hypothetical protein